ncbi:hypothetical protein EDC56_3756 [Sinobacterium caligoides]|uniref:Phospholipase A2-like protein n=1 Tax=Sinobacterium caligoides TaxID=933926 RepID=A0A3N2D584_9GAMM|nr:hypothetical protein [Sinobacterium caligoides]ROR94941.1 hypothetical protein EDC56_3756 [Sinobacterium caligoides]
MQIKISKHLASTMKRILPLLLTVFLFGCSTSAPTTTERNSQKVDQNKHSLTKNLMPKYGNWCGANHPEDINNAEQPINSLDEACMRHDYCYGKSGYFDCTCDAALNDEIISGLKNGLYSGQEKVFARSVHLYFNGSPCNGDHSTKVAPSRFLHNIVKGVGHTSSNIVNNISNKSTAIINKLPTTQELADDDSE